MSDKVIRFWTPNGKHTKRIRIPGPGEQNHEAQIIILPVVHRTPITNPPRKLGKRRKAP